jgi:N-methylhydantoinase B
MIFMAERCRFPAEGAMGGGSGAAGDLTIDGRSVDHRRNVVLTKGQQVVLRTPGGGGFGAPQEREAGYIEEDRRLGYVSGG